MFWNNISYVTMYSLYTVPRTYALYSTYSVQCFLKLLEKMIVSLNTEHWTLYAVSFTLYSVHEMSYIALYTVSRASLGAKISGRINGI
jgi:hypothetical protein